MASAIQFRFKEAFLGLAEFRKQSKIALVTSLSSTIFFKLEKRKRNLRLVIQQAILILLKFYFLFYRCPPVFNKK